MVKRATYIFVFILFSACAGNDPDDSPKGDPGIMRFFEGFPKMQFLNIQLGNPTDEASSFLEQKGYDLTKEESFRYYNKSEEVELIIPDGPTLYSMKVFIYNPTDIKEAEKLHNFFLEQSLEESSNEEFSYYLFYGNEIEFSLTMFEQPEFLRLEYELESSH